MLLKIYVTFISALTLIIAIFLIKSSSESKLNTGTTRKAAIASRFLLTDLCLSTESRHTRRLSQPELIAPFQDAPGYMDHFPSSTFIQPFNPKSSFGLGESVKLERTGNP
ncbi:MAG: hypothetical protein P8X42_00335 [Calditrichaceae bacterium]